MFVIVYNHKQYDSTEHMKHLGKWILSILKHSQVAAGHTLQLKLIGVVDEDSRETEAECEAKINTVLNDCGQTIISYRESLFCERDRLKALGSSEDMNVLKAVELVDKLLMQQVFLNGDILFVESSFGKYEVNKLFSELESNYF